MILARREFFPSFLALFGFSPKKVEEKKPEITYVIDMVSIPADWRRTGMLSGHSDRQTHPDTPLTKVIVGILDGKVVSRQFEDGSRYWYLDGLTHREDGPAIEFVDTNGRSEYWYRNGVMHRDDGPSQLYYHKGSETPYSTCWHKNGERHREDGPAYENVENGHKAWYLNDKVIRRNFEG